MQCEYSSNPLAVLATKNPQFWGWIIVASLVRSPALMSGVALATATAYVFQSPNRDGYLASAFVVGMLLGTPIAVRYVGRFNPKSILVFQLFFSTVMWSLLTVCAWLQLPWLLWLDSALAAGFALSGSGGRIRATLANKVPDELRGMGFPPDGGHRDSGIDGSAGRMFTCRGSVGRLRPSTRSMLRIE